MPAAVSQDSARQVAEALMAYADDFEGFCEDFGLGTPWSRQIEMAEALVTRKQVSCRSCHGSGKTELLAMIVWWLTLCRPKTVICITAPTFRQLVNVVFRRINHMAKRSKFLAGLIKAGHIKTKPTRIDVFLTDSYVTIATAKNPEGLQGEHADPFIGTMVIIVEEASGVAAEFFQAMEGATSTGESLILLVGNPTRTAGKFFDSHNKERAEWHTMHISAFESPFVPAGWIQKMKRMYGEDSDVYRVRVLGEFPRGSGDALVPLTWMEDAIVKTPVPYDKLVGDEDSYVIGVDVARSGDDYSFVVVRRGSFVLGEYVARFRGLTTAPLSGYLQSLYEKLLLKSPVNPNTGRVIKPVICVDAIGVGSGVFDTLKENGANVREVMVSERAPVTSPKCHLLRDWLYWQVREFFNEENGHNPVILVPEPTKTSSKEERAAIQEKAECIDQILAESSDLRYAYNSSGALQVESKDEYRKRNEGRSSDGADALSITCMRENRVPRKKVEDLFSMRQRRLNRAPRMVI